MDILYDHQMFSIQRFGGISRIFIELMKELSANSECSIHWYRGWHKDGYDIQDYRARLGRYWAFPRETFKLQQNWNYDAINKLTLNAFILTSGKKYDIYHPSYYDASLLSIVKPKKLVITIHDMILEKFLSNLVRFQKFIDAKRYLVERADLIFVNSRHTEKDLVELLNVNPEKIRITHWATRIQDICPAKLPDLGCDKPYFLYVGTRSKYKNFNILVQAFAANNWLKSNFNVICFGGTSDFTEPELKSIDANNLRQNFIYLTGDDRLLKALYKQAQGLVYTSRYEGFGLPPLEAMECQCPVICCPTSSLPEVVGDAAAFFSPDSVEELIACMKMIVEDRDERTLMLEKGLERASLFSWEKASKLTLEGYREII